MASGSILRALVLLVLLGLLLSADADTVDRVLSLLGTTKEISEENQVLCPVERCRQIIVLEYCGWPCDDGVDDCEWRVLDLVFIVTSLHHADRVNVTLTRIEEEEPHVKEEYGGDVGLADSDRPPYTSTCSKAFESGTNCSMTNVGPADPKILTTDIFFIAANAIVVLGILIKTGLRLRLFHQVKASGASSVYVAFQRTRAWPLTARH